MYSREQRVKAIALYIKYDKSIADVIRELGYPSTNLLPRWYKAYGPSIFLDLTIATEWSTLVPPSANIR